MTVSLKGRLIMQRLAKNSLNCDEPIDDDTAQEWLKWRNNLMNLDGKSTARCLKPENFGNVVILILLYTISLMHASQI